jgi:hypothetical protein
MLPRSAMSAGLGEVGLSAIVGWLDYVLLRPRKPLRAGFEVRDPAPEGLDFGVQVLLRPGPRRARHQHTQHGKSEPGDPPHTLVLLLATDL